MSNRLETHCMLGLLGLLFCLIIVACSGKEKAFINACYSGDVAQVRKLVETVNVNAADEKGRTGLMVAAWAGRSEIIEFLLFKGANVDVLDRNGYMALDYALREEHMGIAKELIAVHLAAGHDNAKEKILMSLAQQGCASLLSELIDLGTDVNAMNHEGWSPLMTSAWRGHYEVCSFLLEAGADPNIRSSDEEKTWPIIIATVAGHTNIVSLLVDYGANMSVRDAEYVTALMRAVWLQNNNVVSTLLNMGDDPNVKYEELPLVFIAAEIGNWEAVELLKQHGARAKMKFQGITVSLTDYLKIKENAGSSVNLEPLLENGE